jgi:gliding motility-associated-like protein
MHNENGTLAYTVADRNATAWEAHDESWRWYTSDIAWYDEDGVLIGTGPEVDVAPEYTTTYTLVQTLCDGTSYTDDVTVEVGAELTVDSLIVDVSCGGAGDGSIEVDISGGLEPYTYEWSTGATGVTEIGDLDGGTYTVTVTEAGGCHRTYTFTVEEPETLTADAINIEDNPCFDYEEGYAEIDVDGGTVPYSYSLDGGTSTIINEFDNLPAGDYTVTVTDASGCETTVDFTITEPILFTADLTASDMSILGGQPVIITLTTSLPDIVSTSWDPDIALIDPSTVVVDTPFTTTTYYVTVTNDMGCVATDSITIIVDVVPEIFFPTAFSPNGDNVNDIFYGNGYNVSNYHLTIYNRWGEVMYTSEVFSPGIGWDGMVEGNEQEIGTYIWQVSAKFGDGQEYAATGNFTLVR